MRVVRIWAALLTGRRAKTSSNVRAMAVGTTAKALTSKALRRDLWIARRWRWTQKDRLWLTPARSTSGQKVKKANLMIPALLFRYRTSIWQTSLILKRQNN